MGGKYTKYEDTYEIRPKDITFPEDEDSDIDTAIMDHSKAAITVPVVVSDGSDIDTVIVDYTKPEMTVPVSVSDGKRT